MRINVAHLREQGVDFAVFDCDAGSHSHAGRQKLLAELTYAARASGLHIAKSALAYRGGRGVEFFGTPDLVRFLAGLGMVPRWTHTIDV